MSHVIRCLICGCMKTEKQEVCPCCGQTESDFVWCLHCERAFPKKRIQKGRRWCVYDGCHGKAGDLRDWNKFRYYCSHDYPEVPVMGEHYPEY